MPMIKRASLGVLTRQTNGCAINQDRGKSQTFSLPPVNAPLRAKGTTTALQNTSQFWIGREMFWPVQQGLVIGSQLRTGHRYREFLLMMSVLAIPVRRLLLIKTYTTVRLMFGLLQYREGFLHQRISIRLRNRALLLQTAGIEIAHSWM